MLKNILTIAVLGVSALSVMAANAATPGVYVTGQLGYADTHMKSKTGSDNGTISPKGTNLGNNGLAGRLAVGYQFNQNLALELGYLQLKNASYTMDGKTEPGFQSGVEKLRQNAIDLDAKGILPLSDRLNVYGKLGIAYLVSDIDFSYDGSIYNNNRYPYAIARHTWAPEAAVGVSYDITPNVSVDTSWTHIQPLGNKQPGNIDFVAVGIGYNFG